jgi:putative ABC transport system permease protein
MKPRQTFRAFLRMLPEDFRAQYGREMESVYHEQRSETKSAPQAAEVCARTFRDLFAIGVREHMQQLRQDIVYALRNMRRHPGFVAAAVLTLAVGIGANTAMFSVLYSVLLRPLPYRDPGRLVAVWNQWQGAAQGGFSDPEYMDFSERSQTMKLAAMVDGAAAIGGDSGEAEWVGAGYVSTNALGVLGVTPAIGRSFLPEEEIAGRENVAIISDAFWRKRFQGSEGALGQTLLVDAVPTVIVGVLPAGMRMPGEFGSNQDFALLQPLTFDRAAARNKRGGHYLRVIGRLNDGVSIGSARAELASLYDVMKRTYPTEYDIPGFGGHLTTLRDDLLGPSRQTVLILSLAVGLILLLACANVANLMIARGESRRAELGVRIALGASRFRIIRQLVTEGILLSAAGALAGVALAAACQKALLYWAANGVVQLPRVGDVSLNAAVVLFAAGLALLTPLLFGLLPALPVSRAAVSSVLSGGTRGSTGNMRPHVRRALMATQVTIATVLLIASGLLLKSFLRLTQQPSGIRTDHVLTFRVALPEARYAGLHEVATFYDRLLDDISQLPGVEKAGASSGLPLSIASGDWSFDVEGQPALPGKHSGKADWYVITPGYFESLGIPLMSGRLLQSSDDAQAAPVIFLNETAAKSIFPNEDPVGKRIQLTSTTGAAQPWRTIAGVVGDVRQRGLDTPPRAEMFIPHTQFLHFSAGRQARSMTVVVRSRVDPLELMPAIRTRLAKLDPLVPPAQVRDMNEVFALALADRRMMLDLIAAFGALAVLLAIIGVYGVIDYNVVQRTREIGVRMALGASRPRLEGWILKDGMRLVLMGIAIGLVLSVAFGRVLAGLLFEVAPGDVPVFTLTSLLIFVLALAAIYVPARRAARLDPMEALRVE